MVSKTFDRSNSTQQLYFLFSLFFTRELTILLNKLDLYGIRGNVLSWFKSYLTGRKLRVKCRTISNMKETRSKEYPVEYGTPQGSCLGPLIFLIFVNDLHLTCNFPKVCSLLMTPPCYSAIEIQITYNFALKAN